MAAVLKKSTTDWPGAVSRVTGTARRRAAEIIDFPFAPERVDYQQPDLGTAEEFYIATQPFAPQWDWTFRKF
ncbi:MAG: hypothetical protein BroJett030_08750 [Alphaproteobacteria bacterium]|nr:MAG: hypothetical protein BroJett030_08750 [Alphaproteobacteria bacterium]